MDLSMDMELQTEQLSYESNFKRINLVSQPRGIYFVTLSSNLGSTKNWKVIILK